MATTTQPPRTRISPALATLILLIALNLLNFIDRYILPGELSLIQNEFHATREQMGALTTAMFFVYMLAAPLTGWLGDRFSRKPLIIAGAVLWSLATLSTAWVHDYWTLYSVMPSSGSGKLRSPSSRPQSSPTSILSVIVIASFPSST